MNSQPFVSIVTACYNCAAFIERTYASLKAQIYKNFDWIVVNDLSTDETLSKLASFKAEGAVSIRIIEHDANLGPVSTICDGIQHATGTFTLILDHDDELVPAGLERLVRRWQELGDDRLYGVGGRCIDGEGAFIGVPFRTATLITNELELRHVFKIRGELTGMVKTAILKDAYKGMERGMANGIVWRRIAKRYNAIYTNDVIRIYHTDVPNSMTNLKKIQITKGTLKMHLAELNDCAEYILKDPFYFWRSALLYSKYCSYLKRNMALSFRELKPPLARTFFLLSLPMLPILVLRDKLKGRI